MGFTGICNSLSSDGSIVNTSCTGHKYYLCERPSVSSNTVPLASTTLSQASVILGSTVAQTEATILATTAAPGLFLNFVLIII